MQETETKQSRYGFPGVDLGAGEIAVRDEAPGGILGRIRHAVFDWARTAFFTLGTIYVLGWFVVTLGTAALNRVAWQPGSMSNTYSRIARLEGMREYRAPVDSRVTPEQAAIAFDALQPAPTTRPTAGFEYRDATPRQPAAWAGLKITDDMFKSAQPRSWVGPNSVGIITAARAGFSTKEREALRAIATAPVWQHFDLVASAGAVDLVGGRFQTPFGAGANIYSMPIIKFAATKEVAYAAVSRAAWHLSEGRGDSAEAILRRVVSFGYSIVDNGTFVIDDLIGVVIVGIGRDALAQLYELRGDPRAVKLRQMADVKTGGSVSSLDGLNVRDFNLRREALARIAEDGNLPRGFRYEALMSLERSACAVGYEVAFGPRNETVAAIEKARAELARYPAERAVIDLIGNSTTTVAGAPGFGVTVMQGRLADAMSRMYFNPRLASCSILGLNSGVF